MEELKRLEEFYIDINLQLFASPEDEGKTEEPTQRRLREARQKGRVAKTPELSSALVLIVGFSFVAIMAKQFFDHLAHFMVKIFELTATFHVGTGNYKLIFAYLTQDLFKFVLPLFGLVFVVALLAEVLQVGIHFSAEPLKPAFNKISFTWEKLQSRIFLSKQTVANLLKSLAKLAIISLISFIIIRGQYRKFTMFLDNSLINGVSLIAWTAFKIILWVGIFFLVVSFFDYLYQKKSFMESQKMKKQEVKEERIESEGRPEVKQRQQAMYRELINRKKMLKEVPKADVVITNPTHFAVALLYEQGRMNAPQVIAKGQDLFALEIKKVAKEHNVFIQENKVVARALYNSVEVGQEIPPELYSAVIQILVHVYNIKNSKVG